MAVIAFETQRVDELPPALAPRASLRGSLVGASWLVTAAAASATYLLCDIRRLGEFLTGGRGLWVVLLAVFAVWERRQELPGAISAARPPTWSLHALWAGWACAAVLLSPPVRVWSWLGCAATTALLAGGVRLLGLAVVPLLVLAWLPDLPAPVHTSIARSLAAAQLWLAHGIWSMVAPDIIGATADGVLVRHAVRGAHLLALKAECSGVSSLTGMGLLATVLAGRPRLSLRARLAIPLVAVALAFVGNALRIQLTIALHAFASPTSATGAPHAAAGAGVLAVEVVLLLWLTHLWRRRVG
jgi:exosortase/archaeosortase family protein